MSGFGTGQARDAYIRLRAHPAAPRLVFRSSDPRLLALPWELTRGPERPTPLALDLAGGESQPAGELADTVPVPGGRLRPPTLDALATTLVQASEEGAPFHVVHFDGHGQTNDRWFLTPGPRDSSAWSSSTARAALASQSWPRPSAAGGVAAEDGTRLTSLPAISLFQGVADQDLLTQFSQVPDIPASFRGTPKDDWRNALNEAVHVGLLTPLEMGMYRIHPALPAFLATQCPGDRDTATRPLLTACADLGDWMPEG